MASLLALLVGFGLIAGITFVGAVWRGWVLSVVWGWLVVPIFGLAPLSIIGAVTLSLIVGFLTHQPSNCAKDPEESQVTHAVSSMIVYPLIVLIFGWVAKGFI